MHAGFPQVTPGLLRTLNTGMQSEAHLKGLLAQSGGHLVAEGLALALRLGFGLILRDGLLDEVQSRRAQAFFADNFEISDPMTPGGKRYYQGRFLIRTRRAGDDMNVLLEFCPQPDKLYLAMPWGHSLDPFAVVQTHVMIEDEADGMERNGHGNAVTIDSKVRHARFPHLNLPPEVEGANERLREFHNHVDLVIRFKDAETILSLIGQQNVDIVALLLKNLVQLTGNVGHLFKLGAIGADVQRLIAQ